MGQFIPIGTSFVDNRSIISYSPYLLLQYNVHISVECTAGFHAIKYIYKVCLFFGLYYLLHNKALQYVYKGPNHVSLTLHPLYTPDSNTDDQLVNQDETKLYIDGRYISSSEAYSRLMGWSMHKVCFFGETNSMHTHFDRSIHQYFNYKFIWNVNNLSSSNTTIHIACTNKVTPI